MSKYLLEFKGLTLVYYVPVKKIEKFLVKNVLPAAKGDKVRLYVQALESIKLRGENINGLSVRELNYLIEARYGGRRGYYAVKLYTDNPQYVEWGVSQGFLKTLAEIDYQEESGKIVYIAKRDNGILARIDARISYSKLGLLKGKFYSTVLSYAFLDNFIGIKNEICKVMPIRLKANVLPARLDYIDLAELKELGVLNGEEPAYIFYTKRITLEIL